MSLPTDLVFITSLPGQYLYDLTHVGLDEIAKTQKAGAHFLRTIGNVAHGALAAFGVACIWDLKIERFECLKCAVTHQRVMNSGAFNNTVFLVGTGAAALISLTYVALDTLGCDPNRKLYRAVDLLQRAVPKVATLANAVSMAVLIYFGAPVIGCAGFALAWHGTSFLIDVFNPGKERSLLIYLLTQWSRPRASA